MTDFDVLSKAEKVALNARSLRVSHSAIRTLAQQLAQLPVPGWDTHLHVTQGDADMLANYVLVLDTLNFCFWPTQWRVEYKGTTYNGYKALAACLKRAIESDVPITDAAYLKEMTLDDVRALFKGVDDTEIALLERRQEVLNQTGDILLKHFDGKCTHIIAQAEKSAPKLALLLAQHFPSFNDVAEYHGVRVPILKRAQICVIDLWGTFKGLGPGQFTDIDKLTLCADYKLPQILRHHGVLDYYELLAHTVDNKKILESGSNEEIEIRCATIYAGELLRDEMERTGKKILACELDWLLWNLAQDASLDMKPYHTTPTHFY